MRRFVIEVSEEAFTRLTDVASGERRPIKDQAAWLLERHLLSPAESGAVATTAVLDPPEKGGHGGA